jgi:hypothetical protein
MLVFRACMLWIFGIMFRPTNNIKLQQNIIFYSHHARPTSREMLVTVSERAGKRKCICVPTTGKYIQWSIHTTDVTMTSQWKLVGAAMRFFIKNIRAVTRLIVSVSCPVNLVSKMARTLEKFSAMEGLKQQTLETMISQRSRSVWW